MAIKNPHILHKVIYVAYDGVNYRGRHFIYRRQHYACNFSCKITKEKVAMSDDLITCKSCIKAVKRKSR